MNKIILTIIVLGVVVAAAVLFFLLRSRRQGGRKKCPDCPGCPATDPGTFCPANGYKYKTDCSSCGGVATDPGTFCPANGYKYKTDCSNCTKSQCSWGDCPDHGYAANCSKCRGGGTDCSKCQTDWSQCSQHGYEKTTGFNWAQCSDHGYTSQGACTAYCQGKCDDYCPVDCGKACLPLCPPVPYCPKGAGPIVNCDPSSNISCNAAKSVGTPWKNCYNNYPYYLTFGCGIALAVQNGANAIGTATIKDIIGSAALDTLTMDKIIGNLSLIYSLYQEIFGQIKHGSIALGKSGCNVPGASDDYLYIYYSAELIPAAGESTPTISGASVMPPLFNSIYQINKKGTTAMGNVWWYETGRNFAYGGKLDWSRPGDPYNYGWAGQGVIDSIGYLVAPSLSIEYYDELNPDAGSYDDSTKGPEAIKASLAQLKTYTSNPDKYNFTNTFNVTPPVLPWNDKGSTDGIYQGVYTYLFNNYGGMAWYKKFFRCLFLLPYNFYPINVDPPLKPNSSMQDAVDNFYLAASRAVTTGAYPNGQDLYDWFAGPSGLRWPISDAARGRAAEFIGRSNMVYYFTTSPTGHKPYVCFSGDLYKLYLAENKTSGEWFSYYQFFSSAQECKDALAKEKAKAGIS